MIKKIGTIKILLAVLVTLALGTGGPLGTAEAAAVRHSVMLKINDYYVLYTTPHPPYVDTQKRMMIPLRSISELIGAKVGYDAKKKTATIHWDSHTVVFTAGSQTVDVDGTAKQMDTVPALKQNAMYIPISVLAANLGFKATGIKTTICIR